jgi:hypothetical protein
MAKQKFYAELTSGEITPITKVIWRSTPKQRLNLIWKISIKHEKPLPLPIDSSIFINGRKDLITGSYIIPTYPTMILFYRNKNFNIYDVRKIWMEE